MVNKRVTINTARNARSLLANIFVFITGYYLKVRKVL